MSMIGLWSAFWYDLLFLVVASWCLSAAVTGNFYTGGRGGRIRLVAHVKSRLARVVFLLNGAGTVDMVAIDIYTAKSAYERE